MQEFNNQYTRMIHQYDERMILVCTSFIFRHQNWKQNNVAPIVAKIQVILF